MKNIKSSACSKVLQLMDNDFEYQKALAKVLSANKELSKEVIEKELNLYI